MDDEGYVRLVYAHSERICRDHDLLPVKDKVILVHRPFRIGKSGMITCCRISVSIESVADLLNIFS